MEKPNSERFEEIGKEIGKLVKEKDAAYGDSFGRIGNVLREMYPDGIRPEQYDDMATIVRMLDKQFRIANKKDAFGESPYKDIVGYGIKAVERDEREKAMEGKDVKEFFK